MDPVDDNWLRRFRRGMRRLEGQFCRSKGRRLPDFLVIGAQKSGTSWLHQNLLQHPEIFVPEKKELHYFNSDLKLSLGAYMGYFAGSGGKVAGEITPAYSILKDADIALIKALMPKAKLVMLMRDPIDRAWSQAVMEVGDRTGRSAHEVPTQEMETFLRSWPSFGRGDYPSILSRWERHFGAEAILTGFLDEVRLQPENLLNRVFTHIGASEIDDWGEFPVRKVVAPDVGGDDQARGFAVRQSAPDAKTKTEELMPAEIRSMLEELYADVMVGMEQRFGPELPSWRQSRKT